MNIVSKDAVIDRLAKTEREAVEKTADMVHKILSKTETLPVIIPAKDFGSFIVRDKVIKMLKEKGWRVDCRQETVDGPVEALVIQ